MSDVDSEKMDEGSEKMDEIGRDARGRFAPGGPRPGAGRPSIVRPIRELARAQTEEAFHALIDIAMKGGSEAARVAAIREILDRGWGKSTQFVDMPENSNVAVLMEKLFGGQHVLDEIPDE